MIIPKGTLGKIQSLDVYRFKIWKNLLKEKFLLKDFQILFLLESNINLRERNNIIKL